MREERILVLFLLALHFRNCFGMNAATGMGHQKEVVEHETKRELVRRQSSLVSAGGGSATRASSNDAPAASLSPSRLMEVDGTGAPVVKDYSEVHNDFDGTGAPIIRDSTFDELSSEPSPFMNSAPVDSTGAVIIRDDTSEALQSAAQYSSSSAEYAHKAARINDVRHQSMVLSQTGGSRYAVNRTASLSHTEFQDSLSLHNGWVAYGGSYGTPSQSHHNGRCVVEGRLKNGVWNHLANLPAECYPNRRLIFNMNNEAQTTRVDITTNGQIHYVEGGKGHHWISLSGMVWMQNGASLPLHNGWKCYGGGYGCPSYKRIEGVCSVDGLIKDGHWGHLATLPSDCRPNKRLVFNLNNHAKTARVDVLTNGQIHFVKGGQDHHWIALGGIVFGVEGQQDLPLRNGWSAYEQGYGKPSYQVRDDFCVVGGLLKSGSWGHLATLDEECRPHQRLIFNMNNHEKTARVDVLENGEIRWMAGGSDHAWISVAGIAFEIKKKPCDVSNTHSNNEACSCGSQTCDANQYCYDNMCQDIAKTCTEDATDELTESCSCGGSSCSKGQFCYATSGSSGASCHGTETKCDVSPALKVTIACGCGSQAQACQVNQYCYDDKCNDDPDLCNVDTTSATGKECKCGSHVCDADEFCFGSRCHSEALDCSNEPTLKLEEACMCGGTTSCAAGKYCYDGSCETTAGTDAAAAAAASAATIGHGSLLEKSKFVWGTPWRSHLGVLRDNAAAISLHWAMAVLTVIAMLLTSMPV